MWVAKRQFKFHFYLADYSCKSVKYLNLDLRLDSLSLLEFADTAVVFRPLRAVVGGPRAARRRGRPGSARPARPARASRSARPAWTATIATTACYTTSYIVILYVPTCST